MAFKLPERVKETSTTSGTGTITVSGTSTGYRTFASALSVGDTFTYCIVDNTTGDWEIGFGTLATSTTISRDLLISSSTGSAVSFAANSKEVFITQSSSFMLPNEGNTPSTPPAGTLKLLNIQSAGRSMAGQIGPNGIDTMLQPHMGGNRTAMWQPAGNSTTITAVGSAALTATGTTTAANIATTNLHTMQRRLEYLVTTAATTAVAGFRGAAAMWSIGGTASDRGGFHFVCYWGPATGVGTTTNRAFVGMANSTAAPTDVEPSSITNIVGCGWDAADTNIQIMHRGAGAITKIDTGIAVPTADRASAYELALFSPPGTTQSVGYKFKDLVSGTVVTGTITTNLPSTSTFLAPRGWMSVGGTSSVIGIALMNLYLESDR